jgi:malate dehydrogenase
MLAKAYNVKVSQVDGFVIGEHGSTQVYLFSTAKIDGKKINVTEEIKAKIRSEIPNILKRLEELQSGRTAGWTCAIGLEKIVRAIVEDSNEVIPCSVMLDGEYGVKGISMSVPVKLGKNGVLDILEYDLAPDEVEGVKKTVATLKAAANIVEKKL